MELNCIHSEHWVKAELRCDYSQETLHKLLGLGLDFPESLRTAVTKRQIDYLAGRYCAAVSLAALGSPGKLAAPDADRAPPWPAGFTGSITHTKGYVAAMVAKRTWARSLGIDSEWLAKSYTRDISSYVLTPNELAMAPPFLPPPHFAFVVFSAKESLFKCLYPLAKVWFGFQDAEIVGLTECSFQIRLCKPLPGIPCLSWRGSYLIADDLVHTQVLYPRQKKVEPGEKREQKFPP